MSVRATEQPARLGFAYNPTYPSAVALRDRALAWCAERRFEAWAAEARDGPRVAAGLPGSRALVVLGGDGTFLLAARTVAGTGVPLLGVNTGKVGFLSRAEAADLEAVLEQVVAGAYDLEARMLLEATILPGGGEAGQAPHVALNEAAVVRGSQARVVRLDVTIDGSHLATYIADGLVVATPTGSTGYSFSAGGPILDPTSRNLVVTPVAAYLAGIRSIVVGPRHTVLIRVESAHEVQVSIDGREDVPLRVGDVVRVRAREQPIHFIAPHGSPAFWELLRRKVELLPS